MAESAHEDTFVLERLPPPEVRPQFRYDLPDLRWQDRLNCADVLLESAARSGPTDRRSIIGNATAWTYEELRAAVDQIAHVLVTDLGLRPGNRVLLTGFNSPMLIAAWFAIVKAGGIVVTVVASLQEAELQTVLQKVRPSLALCDARLAATVRSLQDVTSLRHVISWGGDLERRMQHHPGAFTAVDTAADDPCLIAFTSGSTGAPKAAVHSHRAVMATCACFRGAALHPAPSDVFIGTPPVAFTFGLLGLVAYPIYVGASLVLLERPSARELAEQIERHHATVCFTVPTVYRQWLRSGLSHKVRSLRVAVSSGEALPAETWQAFVDATGIEIVNVLGSTEMLHAYMSTGPHPARPGSVGKPIRGYRAAILDADGRELPDGELGELAVQGPTGCLYLEDEMRQRRRVRNGWTLSGDLARRDEDGYYWLYGRSDNIIVTSGYNVAPAEVEAAMLAHPAVVECYVTSEPDPERGARVVAVVVTETPVQDVEALLGSLQGRLAPYKWPRTILFMDQLPRTPTGKVLRRSPNPENVGKRIDL